MSARMASASPGVSITTGGPAAPIIARSASGDICPSPRLAWRAAPVPGGCREAFACNRSMRPTTASTRSTAPSRSSPAASAWQAAQKKPGITSASAGGIAPPSLAGGMRVAGVEAEAELDVGLGRGDRLPQPRQRVEAPGDGIVAAGGVLDEDGHVGLQHLERARPAADALVDAVLGVAAVDDHGGGAGLRGPVTGLLENLARPVADVAARRAHVDEVRRVDVQRHPGGPELVRVLARRRLGPALRVGQEDLDTVSAEAGGLLERPLATEMGSDDRLRHARTGTRSGGRAGCGGCAGRPSGSAPRRMRWLR